MFKPKFIVLLAAYNGIKYIDAQLISILQQSRVDVTIFISVDYSSDLTYSRCCEIAKSNKNKIYVLPYGEKFGGAGPNFYRLLRDVELNGFNYLSFSDQDDIWHPDKLWRAHSLITSKGAQGYSSSFTAFWPSGKSKYVSKAFPQRKFDYLFESAGPGCTYVLKISLALQFKDLILHADKSLLNIHFHDWLIYAFARFGNHDWIIDSWSSIQYRQHDHNQIGVNSGFRSFWLRVRKILTGYGFEQSLLISDVLKASNLPIVTRGLRSGCLGYFWLMLRANQCRRKRFDQFHFFIACVILGLIKSTNSAKYK